MAKDIFNRLSAITKRIYDLIPPYRLSLELFVFFVVFGSAAVVVWLVSDYVYTNQSCPPNFDEAVHTIPTIQIAHDILNGDIGTFLQHSYEQDQQANYPFFHSWLASLFLVVPNRIDLTAVRLANIVFAGISILLAYPLAGKLVPETRYRWIAGVVSAGLMVAAVPLWAYSSRVYLEPVGLLISFSALYCYLKFDPEQGNTKWGILTSLLVALAFFSKYSFGIFLLGAIFLSETLHIIWNKFTLKRWLALFAPCFLLLAGWFANPDKIAGFLSYSRAQDANMALSFESLAFYPRSIANIYGYTLISKIILFSGLILGLARIKTHQWRAIAAYILVSLLVVTFVPQKNHRFAYTIAPMAMILAGGAVAWMANYAVRLKDARLKYGLLILICVIIGTNVVMGAQRLAFVNAAQEVVLSCPPADIDHAYRFVIEHSLMQGAKPYILNPWHFFNVPGLAQTYYGMAALPSYPNPQQIALAGLAPEPTGPNLQQLVQSWQSENVSIMVSIDGSPAGQYTGWQVMEPLWQQGDVEWVVSGGPYAVRTWTTEYTERTLKGDFESWAAVEIAKSQGGSREFPIHIHIYRKSP